MTDVQMVGLGLLLWCVAWALIGAEIIRRRLDAQERKQVGR